MPEPKDNILREKDDEEIEINLNNSVEQNVAEANAEDRFEELSRLARERDYAELEQKRQRSADAEADYQRKMTAYNAEVAALEASFGMKIEEIDRLHNISQKYSFCEAGYNRTKGLTDAQHLYFNIAEKIRAANGSEDEKKQLYYESVFEKLKEKNPWLEKWNTDTLVRCYSVNIPQRPQRQDAVGEKSQASYLAELEAQRLEFSQSFDELDDIRRAYDEQHPDDPVTEEEKLLDKFWEQLWEISTKIGNDTDTQLIKDINEVMTPVKSRNSDKPAISPADNMINLYLEYLRVAHKDQDPTHIVPTPDEKHILELTMRCNSAMTRYADMLEESIYGSLVVPPAGEKSENGKKIHRVNAAGKNPKLTKEYITKQKKDANVEINFESKRDVPLFKNGPKPSDVEQGKLGDCYFLASLMTLAAQNPALIRDAMKDNNDGTVTVRFFNEENEPVYVTVDKSVPKNNGNAMYAQDRDDSLWVQILEKAYVQSGLAVRGGLEKAEAGKLGSSYSDIDGGYEWQAIARFIGVKEGLLTKGHRSIKVPKASKEQEYQKGELNFANELKSALAGGHLVTASTPYSRILNPLDQRHNTVGGISAAASGISEQHAYALLGVDEENGKYYVTVRNPHGSKGINTASDGTLLSASEKMADGYSRLELRDFMAYFADVNVSTLDMNAVYTERMAESKNIVRQYGETVKKIVRDLQDTDSAMMYFRNSDQFCRFRDAAVYLDKMMQSPAPTEKKLNACLERFFEKAKAYSDYCQRDKKINPFKDSQRAFKRYETAKIAQEMKSVYESNKDKTLKEKWNEFSYSEAKKKVNVPATAETLSKVYRSVADNMANHLNGRENEFADQKSRTRLYKFLESFAAGNGAKKMNDKFASLENDADSFKYLQNNAQTFCAMQMLENHPDIILKNMQLDGYTVKNHSLAEMLQAGKNTAAIRNNEPQQKNNGIVPV